MESVVLFVCTGLWGSVECVTVVNSLSQCKNAWCAQQLLLQRHTCFKRKSKHCSYLPLYISSRPAFTTAISFQPWPLENV